MYQQIRLDKAVKEAHKMNQDYSNQMIIALYTEVGEFANEIQSFKYWKKSKNIDQNNLLEEFADGLHFLISFAIKTKPSVVKWKDINNITVSSTMGPGVKID